MSDIISEVKKLQLPLEKYSVVGGGALAARDIRKFGDIDLIVTDDLYQKMKNDGWEEREKRYPYFHLYKGNAEVAKNFSHIDGCMLDHERVIENSDIIEGIPFMSLPDLIKLKQAMGREKDLKDIELILNYMKK
ncbi:MAG: hypothetical protein V4509_00275 [Patescibacteria group bacterium]